ncbi:MAG TPA: transglycosylase domain-containing protein, partial [Candidatus Methylacidiphilales bacterium]
MFLLLLVPKPPLLDGLGYSSEYLDKNGRLLRLGLAPDERYRLFTPLGRISPFLVEATLLHEDRYYYDHPGANPVALAKALENECRGNARRIGASTITMQVARLRFHLHTRTWAGKLLQIVRGAQLEIHYSKREILEAYFNLAPYGRNIEGIGAASRIYYDKDPAQLTLSEAVTLASIPQSPARRAPRHPDDPDPNLVRARQTVFAQWLQIHPGDADKGDRLALPPHLRVREELPFLAPHFVDALPHAPGGGPIRTTLDLDLQHLLESRMADYVSSRQSQGVRNGAAILVDYTTMEVVAAVGSANYFSREIDGQVDGLAMHRSPGSALKPLIYALAMQEGLIQPHSLLKDTPTSFAGYNPENFDKGFVGPI